MNQEENFKEKSGGAKGLLNWVKDLLRIHAPELTTLPESSGPDAVTSLISRAAGERTPAAEERETEGGESMEEQSSQREQSGPEEKKGCPYAMRRNIVISLQEIRRFAEEHDLAAAMIKALLTTLAEMALGALKGKVSGTVLAILLNALNYERDKAEAYRQGELDGRNAKIVSDYFPGDDDGLPHFKGAASPTAKSPDIFSVAKDA